MILAQTCQCLLYRQAKRGLRGCTFAGQWFISVMIKQDTGTGKIEQEWRLLCQHPRASTAHKWSGLANVTCVHDMKLGCYDLAIPNFICTHVTLCTPTLQTHVPLVARLCHIVHKCSTLCLSHYAHMSHTLHLLMSYRYCHIVHTCNILCTSSCRTQMQSHTHTLHAIF